MTPSSFDVTSPLLLETKFDNSLASNLLSNVPSGTSVFSSGILNAFTNVRFVKNIEKTNIKLNTFFIIFFPFLFRNRLHDYYIIISLISNV